MYPQAAQNIHKPVCSCKNLKTLAYDLQLNTVDVQKPKGVLVGKEQWLEIKW